MAKPLYGQKKSQLEEQLARYVPQGRVTDRCELEVGGATGMCSGSVRPFSRTRDARQLRLAQEKKAAAALKALLLKTKTVVTAANVADAAHS